MSYTATFRLAPSDVAIDFHIPLDINDTCYGVRVVVSGRMTAEWPEQYKVSSGLQPPVISAGDELIAVGDIPIAGRRDKSAIAEILRTAPFPRQYHRRNTGCTMRESLQTERKRQQQDDSNTISRPSVQQILP